MSFEAKRGPHHMTFFALTGPLAPTDIPKLCERAAELLLRDDGDLVCDVGAADPDVVTVDALARLQLVASRRGRCIRLHGASRDLKDLLAFTGLCAVVPALRVDPVGQAEQREEVLGVEEEADPGDLVP
jgi:hypothetical protein